MDYVEGSADGWTELRVHGVAGTSPEAVLEHAHVALVAGNAEAGFFRRLWEAASTSTDTARQREEAYSWGGLTSGDNTRALWLLLLPFMLLNVAFYMVPHPRTRNPLPPDGDDGANGHDAPEDPRARTLDRVAQALQRLLALSFTGVFALTAVTVAMDLVGWQCAAGRPNPAIPGDVCGSHWLGWLAVSWLDRPGRQLAVTALVPLAVIAVLWRLGNATWSRLEGVPVEQTVGGEKVVTPFEDRAMWNGRAAVRRLRAVHVTTGLAVPGIFAVAPLPAAAQPAKGIVLVALLLLVGWMVGEASQPGIGRRERPAPPASMVSPESDRTTAEQARETQEKNERRDRYRWLPAGALALTAAALVVAFAAPAGVRPSGGLPWLSGTVYGLFVVQSTLLSGVAVLCWALRQAGAQQTPPGSAPEPAPEIAERTGHPAWQGLAQPGIALIAWVLAGGFSAGVILRVAQTFGTPVATTATAGTRLLAVPAAYTWAAVAGLVLGVVTVLTAVVLWLRLRRPSTAMKNKVDTAYGAVATQNTERRDEIAHAWTRATLLSSRMQGAIGFLLVVSAVVVVVGAVGVLRIGKDLVTDVPWLVDLANLAISAFVLGLVAVGRRAYRSPALRRSVGVAWDLGTFWPRAVHPLAPPCYAERAIPDLIERLRYYTGADAGRVLLSCHSEGTVLGAAVVLQVETAVSARTDFLTYGSPLTRLYGGFFPAYVNATSLDRVGSLLSVAADADAAHERSTWRWRNLYRPTDPIGGAVFRARDLDPADGHADRDPGDVDRPLVDPLFARPVGDTCYPLVRGHSHYFDDPAFAWTADALRAGVLPRACVPPR
jgi:hypothetical protein